MTAQARRASVRVTPVLLSLGMASSPAAAGPSPAKGDRLGGTIAVRPVVGAARDGGAMDAPQFVVDFVNGTGRDVSAMEVLAQEAVWLDGSIHSERLLTWTGPPVTLRAGSTWTHTVDLADFLCGIQWESMGCRWSDFSPGLGRSRLEAIPLARGEHVVQIRIGRARSARVSFEWAPATPPSRGRSWRRGARLRPRALRRPRVLRQAVRTDQSRSRPDSTRGDLWRRAEDPSRPHRPPRFALG